MPRKLRILHVSQLPASPPTFGAQARIHGLLTEAAKRCEITALGMIDPEFNLEDCRRAMSAYCRDVQLVSNPLGSVGWRKRLIQLGSMFSSESFERRRLNVPSFDRRLNDLIAENQFDVVLLEFAHLAHRFRLHRRPPLVIDAHAIDYDVVRQASGWNSGLYRYLYGSINWPKLRNEELAAFELADGICTCSQSDQTRILQEIPSARTRVIPNSADTEFYKRRLGDPIADCRTVLFFGLLSTYPNIDGINYFLDEIWPLIFAAKPTARLKIIGAHPPPELLARASPSVIVTGLVDDLRPHLASAAVLVVPLRMGGGTRLKIVEGMAMEKAIVSTHLGAEGIDAVAGKEILLEDEPRLFADAVIRLLGDPSLAARMGSAARQLVVQKYSWVHAARSLEEFLNEIVSDRAMGERQPKPLPT